MFKSRFKRFVRKADEVFDFFTSKQWQPQRTLLEEPAAPAKKVATASTLHRQPVPSTHPAWMDRLDRA